MKVLFVSFEVSGIFKTGGLGDVAAALPKALKKKGVNVSILMPGYEGIKRPILLPKTTIPVLYVKDHRYFDIAKKFTHAENFERFFYFCLKAVNIIEREKPDIIHLNDWHTGLIAFLLKQPRHPESGVRPGEGSHGDSSATPQNDGKIPKIILTIHNAGFQGDFSLDHVDDFKNKDTKEEFLKLGFKSRVNFLKSGIDNADFVTTVSSNYVKEMLYKNLGYGLEKNLKNKEAKFIGILNGIDYSIWDPKKDRCLDDKYSLDSSNEGVLNWKDGKKKNKAALQKKLKLPMDKNIPVVAFVARLSWQKGIEKIIESMVEISRMGIQLIILGQGDKYYEEKLKKLKEKYEDRFLSVRLKFDEKLAHQIYAGADMFLIPSKYEPCGLTQMISMKYGTIPLARSTGGLVDSIRNGETGFLFADDTPKPMLNAIKKATGIYYDWVDWEMITKNNNIKGGNTKNERFLSWPKMVEKVMKEDFSWDKSAEKYLKIYNHLTDNN